MQSTSRRSQALQKKLQRRNNSLKPADFTKDQNVVSHVNTKKDPVEKSKAALSDLRKRIDERKRVSTLIDVEQYQERREEPIPELTGVTFSESPISERQEPCQKDETLAQTITRSTQKQNQVAMSGNIAMNNATLEKVPSRGIKNHYRDQYRYRKEEEMLASFDKAPPAQIQVRSSDTPNDDDDNNTEVSEITTDVRIMSTNGAAYAERRMAGNVQMRLVRPSLSTPTGRHLERDVNINVSNLRHLGKAVEQAKMDLRKEMTPVNATTRRHGLPYEATDYRPSVDEDEVDSWGDAIRTDFQKQRKSVHSPTEKEEQNGQFIAGKTAAKKIQKLVKEAYSYEGDVFIDATEIREEDLDDEESVLSDEGGNPTTPIKLDDATVGTSVLLGDEILPSDVEEEKMATNRQREGRNEFVQQSREEADREDDNISAEISFVDNENIENDEQSLKDLEKKSSRFTNNPAAIASDFYNSSLGFFKSVSNQVDTQFKSVSNQVDTQLKTFQQRGLISKSDMDGMLGVLEHDVKETETKLPKDGDDVVILLGDEFETSACGTDLKAVAENLKKNTGSNPDPVEKMLESLKKSYNTGVSKCGIDSDLIKENTKAIEEMVANLKNPKRSSSDSDQNDASEVGASKAKPESLLKASRGQD
jgi:hypothetical protein